LKVNDVSKEFKFQQPIKLASQERFCIIELYDRKVGIDLRGNQEMKGFCLLLDVGAPETTLPLLSPPLLVGFGLRRNIIRTAAAA
jgi:hypothetical protein